MMKLEVPSRWFPYNVNTQHAANQIAGYLASKKRFNVVTGGRRQYKTETAKRKMIHRVMSCHDITSPFYIDSDSVNFACLAPIHEQAYRIWWNDLIKLSPKNFIQYINIQRRVIHYRNGVSLYVLGTDMAARLEGIMWYGFGIDEFPNVKPDVWFEHLRPCLSDTLGFCDFLGVPEGKHNMMYDMWCLAETNPENFDRWHWTSAEVLNATEIEDARREYDEATFRQEYEGTFENYQGRAYYCFDRDMHRKILPYQPKEPIWVTFDFNVSPGVCIIGQYCMVNGVLIDNVLSEINIAEHSTTEKVCGMFIQKWFQHEGLIEVDGDATGGAHDTTSGRTDWEIIRSLLDSNFGKRVRYNYPSRNPHERDRVNTVNARLKSLSGDIRTYIHPDCKKLIEDLDRTMLTDKGEIDDKTNKRISHMSDALGYHMVRKFPIKKYVETSQTQWK